MKHALLTFLLFIATYQVFSQNKKQVLYDDWPTTVPSNGDRTKEARKEGDVNSSFVPIGTTWNHRIITYFFQNGTDDLAGNNERQAIRDGFALWSAQTDLAFLEVCSDGEADIVVLWGAFNHGDSGPFDGANGILAHTLGGPPPNIFGNQAGDIHFDDSENWTLASQTTKDQPIDLVTVAAHEIGHALGLDHTTVSGSLMLASYTGSHRFLGQDDIAGIVSLYGIRNENLISGTSTACSPTTTYNLLDQPSNTTITWSSSNPNGYKIDSSTGTATRVNNFNGLVTVTGSLASSCGSTTITKKLVIGSPTPRITAHQVSAYGEPTRVEFTATLISGATYNWYYDNSLKQSTNGNSVIFYFPCGSTRTVTCKISNVCGTSGASNGIAVTGECIRTTSYSISPNPATSMLTVSETSEETEVTAIGLDNSRKKISEIRILDRQGVLKLAQKYDLVDEAILDVKHLEGGLYFIEIFTVESKETQRLLIQR